LLEYIKLYKKEGNMKAQTTSILNSIPMTIEVRGSADLERKTAAQALAYKLGTTIAAGAIVAAIAVGVSQMEYVPNSKVIDLPPIDIAEMSAADKISLAESESRLK
jgi:hypothetical protein